MTDEFDFTAIIDHAETLIKSGKCAELDNLGAHLHAVIQKDDEWLVTVFTSLHYRNCLEFKKLKSTIERGGDNLSDMAWHTRNLLEVCIWVTYCCKNRENAHVFYSDAGRDNYEMLTTFQRWVNTTHFDPQNERYNKAITHLEASAKNVGVSDLEDPYSRIDRIAREIGLGGHFPTLNKSLSKFVHPTAYSIIRNGREDIDKGIKDSFYPQACIQFLESFKLLEDAIKKLYAASTEHQQTLPG